MWLAAIPSPAGSFCRRRSPSATDIPAVGMRVASFARIPYERGLPWRDFGKGHNGGLDAWLTHDRSAYCFRVTGMATIHQRHRGALIRRDSAHMCRASTQLTPAFSFPILTPVLLSRNCGPTSSRKKTAPLKEMRMRATGKDEIPPVRRVRSAGATGKRLGVSV